MQEVHIKARSNEEFKEQLRAGLVSAGYSESEAHIAADLVIHAVQSSLANVAEVTSRIGDPSLQLQLIPTTLNLLSHLAKERADEAQAVVFTAFGPQQSDEEMAKSLADALGLDPEAVLANYHRFVAEQN